MKISKYRHQFYPKSHLVGMGCTLREKEKGKLIIHSLTHLNKNFNKSLIDHIHTIIHLHMKREEIQQDSSFLYHNYSSETSKEAQKIEHKTHQITI